jgi:antibiotic biosynthesis monooxygenase (ABM) superfamily enzyme
MANEQQPLAKTRIGDIALIERHVTFNVIPRKEKDFETLFKDAYSIAMSKQPGFVSVALLKEHEKEAIYQMVIRFQSLESAAAWRDSAEHQALSPRIKALYQESTVQVYEVIAEK